MSLRIPEGASVDILSNMMAELAGKPLRFNTALPVPVIREARELLGRGAEHVTAEACVAIADKYHTMHVHPDSIRISCENWVHAAFAHPNKNNCFMICGKRPLFDPQGNFLARSPPDTPPHSNSRARTPHHIPETKTEVEGDLVDLRRLRETYQAYKAASAVSKSVLPCSAQLVRATSVLFVYTTDGDPSAVWVWSLRGRKLLKDAHARAAKAHLEGRKRRAPGDDNDVAATTPFGSPTTLAVMGLAAINRERALGTSVRFHAHPYVRIDVSADAVAPSGTDETQYKTTVCGLPKCGRRTDDMKRCSRCMQVFYCSGSCHAQHWPAHREVCVPSDKSVPWV